MRPEAVARRCTRVRLARGVPAAALPPDVASPMRTARGVWLSAGRRGWSFASAGGPSGGPEQSNLLEQRGGQLAVNLLLGQGGGSGSGGLVEASSRRRVWRRTTSQGGARRRCAGGGGARGSRPHTGGVRVGGAHPAGTALLGQGVVRALYVPSVRAVLMCGLRSRACDLFRPTSCVGGRAASCGLSLHVVVLCVRSHRNGFLAVA